MLRFFPNSPVRRRLLKVLIAIAAMPLLVVGSCAALIKTAEWRAKSFCDAIPLGSDIGPAIAWGVILVLLRRLTNGTRLFGPIRERLGRRAYAIYIIHPPVLVAIALAWRQVAAPQLVKFAVTGTVTCFACYLLAGLLVRCPGVRRIV